MVPMGILSLYLHTTIRSRSSREDPWEARWHYHIQVWGNLICIVKVLCTLGSIIFLYVVQYKIRKLQIPWAISTWQNPPTTTWSWGLKSCIPQLQPDCSSFRLPQQNLNQPPQIGWHYERCLIYNYPACKVIITNTVRLCPHLCKTVTLSREWMVQEKGERLITIPRQVVRLPSHPHFPEEAARERLNSSRTRLGMENRLHN